MRNTPRCSSGWGIILVCRPSMTEGFSTGGRNTVTEECFPWLGSSRGNYLRHRKTPIYCISFSNTPRYPSDTKILKRSWSVGELKEIRKTEEDHWTLHTF